MIRMDSTRPTAWRPAQSSDHIARSPCSVIALIICFLSIAGHYVLLNAQFLAMVHVIVYTGAIMVLFLFVIMLFNLNTAS